MGERGEHMSDQFSDLRRRSVAASAGALLALLLATAANAAPFLPANCIGDAAGPNDVPGETDVTRSCISGVPLFR